MFLTEENKTILIQKIKDFAITLGFMTLAVSADFVAANLGLFNIDPLAAAFIGAFMGRISHWAEDHYKVIDAVAGALKRSAGRVANALKPKHRG